MDSGLVSPELSEWAGIKVGLWLGGSALGAGSGCGSVLTVYSGGSEKLCFGDLGLWMKGVAESLEFVENVCLKTKKAMGREFIELLHTHCDRSYRASERQVTVKNNATTIRGTESSKRSTSIFALRKI